MATGFLNPNPLGVEETSRGETGQILDIYRELASESRADRLGADPWMAFRRKDRPIYVANVHYFGDVDVLGVEPENLDIRAWVQVPEPQEIVPGRNALVALVPMLAPYHLFMNASAAWAPSTRRWNWSTKQAQSC